MLGIYHWAHERLTAPQETSMPSTWVAQVPFYGSLTSWYFEVDARHLAAGRSYKVCTDLDGRLGPMEGGDTGFEESWWNLGAGVEGFKWKMGELRSTICLEVWRSRRRTLLDVLEGSCPVDELFHRDPPHQLFPPSRILWSCNWELSAEKSGRCWLWFSLGIFQTYRWRVFYWTRSIETYGPVDKGRRRCLAEKIRKISGLGQLLIQTRTYFPLAKIQKIAGRYICKG